MTQAQRAVIGELTHDGATNATIARRLSISEHTVKSHLKDAMKATGSLNRTALVVDLLRGYVKLRTTPTRWVDRQIAA